MNRDIRTVRHAGGTRPPGGWMKRCSRTQILGWRALQVVPHRAPCSAKYASVAAESCGSWVTGLTRGTEGHDGRNEPNRDHGRTS